MWSLISLTAAFVDLAIAYFLLCASALAFFASKLLNIFGLNLPCPCHGFFFFEIHGGRSFCLNRLLIDFPAQKISDVLQFANQAYPFNGCCCTSTTTTISSFSDTTKSVDGSNLIVRAENLKGKGIVISRRRRRIMLRDHRKRVRECSSTIAALRIELEKERNASATAAEEAMSMILRLQEEKAIVEMESRQFQRLIEEKSAHDAEEISILREILVRREREKLFLEKELEAYRNMITLDENDYKLLSGISLDKVRTTFIDFMFEESHDRINLEVEQCEEENHSSSTEEKFVVACDGIESNNPYEDKQLSNSQVVSEKDDIISMETSAMESLNTNGNNDGLKLPPSRPSTLSLLAELRRNSMSSLDREMLITDAEVNRLLEKLRLAREDRAKVASLSMDVRTKSLDDIGEEVLQESLSRKVKSQGLSKKRRCTSVSSGLWTTLKGSLN